MVQELDIIKTAKDITHSFFIINMDSREGGGGKVMTLIDRLMEPIIQRVAVSMAEYIFEMVIEGLKKTRNRPRMRGVRNLHPMPFFKKTPHERWGFGRDDT